jgi:hypothetical protein
LVHLQLLKKEKEMQKNQKELILLWEITLGYSIQIKE